MTKGNNVYEEPIKILAKDGKVAVSGPDGSVVVLSPEAAEETSDRLWKGAMFARQQQRQSARQTNLSEERPTESFADWSVDLAANSSKEAAIPNRKDASGFPSKSTARRRQSSA